MSKKRIRKSHKETERNNKTLRKRRTIALFTLAMILVGGATIFAWRIGVQRDAQKPMAVNGLDPSSPTKEMVFAGNRAIASEEAATTFAFTDVPTSNPYYSDIINIAGRGVTLGCGGGFFCTGSNVTRGQMAAFIMRSLGEFNPPTPSFQRFFDVAPDNGFYNFIDRMYVLGITVGCAQVGQNLYYCPNDYVTHGQMAAFMERALKNPDPTPPAQSSFCDVSTNYLFFALIEDYANLRRIWPGCSGTGTCTGIPNCSGGSGKCFCPENLVRRDEMAHILVRAFDFY